MNKIKNSIAFDAYEEMIAGSKKCKETLDFNGPEHGDFNNGVMNLMASCDTNPFIENKEASSIFSDMRYNYKKILAKGVDKKVSRRRVMKCAWDLCQLNVENPFEKEIEIIVIKENVDEIKIKNVYQLSAEEKNNIDNAITENSLIDRNTKKESIMIFNEDEKNKIEKKPNKKGKFSKFFDHKED